MIRRSTSRNRGEGGYMLLAILFMLFLLMLAATIAIPNIKHEINREREIEMIHRGEQYARAIKKYYKKFNRYPTRIEELENTNNLRFLRKRYKDPMNPEGGKFRLLYYGDLRIAQNAGRGSSGSTASGSGSQDSPPPASAFGQSSGFGSQQQSQQQQDQGSQSAFGSGQSGTLGGSQPGSSSQPQGLGGQVFGGGPIVGVASGVEKDGIHEFNNKKRYDQWMFLYDPGQDRGGLIKGPYQPQQGAGMGGSGVPGINAPGTMQGMPMGNPQQPQQIPQPLQNPVQQ